MIQSEWRKCLINADSRELIKRIPDNSIDLILTDPPYNLGQHSTGNIPLPGRAPMNNDVAAWDLIDFNPEDWADEFVRILKPTGNLFIFTSYNQIGRWYNSLDHKFDTSNFMVWHKTNPAPKIFKAGFLNSCEMIFTCWNKKHTWNFLSQKEMHNFLESPICMRPERLSNPKHPTQKPVAILKKIIEIASNKNDIVFDPFMGVGSTGVAAIELNRRFIGVDIEKTYFMAAKQRIENKIEQDNSINEASEPLCRYGNEVASSLNGFFGKSTFEEVSTVTSLQFEKSSLNQPIKELTRIIKWAGGKEKELKYIIPRLPEKINRFVEPFVGGGSVFTAVQAHSYLINDLSTELIGLYKCIQDGDNEFFKFSRAISRSWIDCSALALKDCYLKQLYLNYRAGEISASELKGKVTAICLKIGVELNDVVAGLPKSVGSKKTIDILVAELQSNLQRKLLRMRKIEEEKGLLPDSDIDDNIEAAMKSSLYMFYRTLYNDSSIQADNKALHTSLFHFIRNFCYSGMFRYNSRGEFNVPYGGIGYNGKSLEKQLDYYASDELKKFLTRVEISNQDFEDFLSNYDLCQDDFVFLDPPYDSEFSTYARNEFTKADQKRLADYLINRCRAKWMLVIKNTPFIFDLYNKEGINIQSFEKQYTVSFMNRNDKATTHLLITNY